MAQRKPIIGLTGGIGSGKTLVAQQMAALGAAVIDADKLGRRALDDPPVRDQLVAWWGENLLRQDGTVDRRRLAQRVFDDPEALRRLESVVHPWVGRARRELHDRYHHDPDVAAIVEDCPLLLETGLDAECDVIIFVDADRAARLARVEKTRGWDDRELARRENLQLGLDKKAGRADYVIDNTAGPEACLRQVQRVFSQITETGLEKQAMDPNPQGRP